VTQYDTRNFNKFKPILTQIPFTTFISGRVILDKLNYYPYLYNMNVDSTTIEFDINNTCYKHSDILSYNSLESLDVQVFTYDYNNYEATDDATIVEQYHITNIGDRQSIELLNAHNINHFINIKMNFNLTYQKLLSFLSELNLYITDYNNYEYDFNVPEKNNIKIVTKIKTYEYDSSSTNELVIEKANTNYCLFHKNVESINVNTNVSIPVYIQVSQISNGIVI